MQSWKELSISLPELQYYQGFSFHIVFINHSLQFSKIKLFPVLQLTFIILSTLVALNTSSAFMRHTPCSFCYVLLLSYLTVCHKATDVDTSESI
jgi:hypothetical protein